MVVDRQQGVARADDVAAAKLQGVDAEGDGQLVHCGLHREGGLGHAVSA